MTVIDLAAWKLTHVKAQCAAVTTAEDTAAQWLRFWSAVSRDFIRQWCGV